MSGKIGTLEVTIRVFLNSDVEPTNERGETSKELQEIVDAATVKAMLETI